MENTSLRGIHEDKEGHFGKGLRFKVKGRCEELYGILLLGQIRQGSGTAPGEMGRTQVGEQKTEQRGQDTDSFYFLYKLGRKFID